MHDCDAARDGISRPRELNGLAAADPLPHGETRPGVTIVLHRYSAVSQRRRGGEAGTMLPGK